MMDPRDDGPATPLTTTRVSGGSSARAVALVVVGVLASVVAIGVAGRPASDPPRGATQDSAVAQSNSAAPSRDPQASPTPRPSRPAVLRERIIPLGEDQFAVTGTIGERYFYELLEEIQPGRLYGTIRVPFPRPAKMIRLEIAQLWTREDRTNHVPIEQLRLPLDHLAPETRLQGRLLDLTVPERPKATDAPRPIRLGYSLLIRAESRLSFGVLTFDLRLGESSS